MFSGYKDTVKYDKYDGVIESYDAAIKVDTDTINSFSMKQTFLTEYVDVYYYYTHYGRS